LTPTHHRISFFFFLPLFEKDSSKNQDTKQENRPTILELVGTNHKQSNFKELEEEEEEEAILL